MMVHVGVFIVRGGGELLLVLKPTPGFRVYSAGYNPFQVEEILPKS